MKKPKLIVQGDLHLDPLIWRSHKNVTGDAYEGLRQVVDLALEWHLPLILAGDILDTVLPHPQVIRWFRMQISRCQVESVPVYCIQGNHDKRPVPWYLAAHDWPKHIGDGVPLCIGGIPVAGLDYDVLDRITESVVDIDPSVQMLVLHQACRQAVPWEGRWNLDLASVPKTVKLVAMGDIHNATEYDLGDGRLAFYTGSTHARDMAEIGPKSTTMVFDDLSIERISLRTRPIEKFVVTDLDKLTKVQEWVETQLQSSPILPPMVQVLHTPECAEGVSRLELRFQEHVIFVTERHENAEQIRVAQTLDISMSEEFSKERILSKLVDPDQDKQLYQFILDLLDESSSTVDVIERYRNHFYEEFTP